MIKFSVKCFHPNEEEDLGEAFEMIPTDLLEFGTVTYQCPNCGHEVIMKMEIEDLDCS